MYVCSVDRVRIVRTIEDVPSETTGKTVDKDIECAAAAGLGLSRECVNKKRNSLLYSCCAPLPVFPLTLHLMLDALHICWLTGG